MHKKWPIRYTTRKYKPPMDKIPQNEVLLLYIKVGRTLQRCFKIYAIENDYTLDLGLICASKYRYITDLSTIQPPLKNPLSVFSKTPSKRCTYKPKDYISTVKYKSRKCG